MELRPNEAGFIHHWLISGCKDTPYATDYTNPDQLEFEIRLREQIADDSLAAVPQNIKLGEAGLEEHPWEYYPAFYNWFVDRYKFYFLLTKVELYASTVLCVCAQKKVEARLWTYAAAELWVNGQKTAAITKAVYKPMNYADVTLELKPGENDIFVRLQNLGVRDTRTIFGLQLKGDFADVTVKTHDYERVLPLIAAEEMLRKVCLRDSRLLLDQEPTIPIAVNSKALWEKGCEYPLTDGSVEIKLSTVVNGTVLERKLENSPADKPRYGNAKSLEAHRQKYFSGLYAHYDYRLQNLRYALMLDKVRLDKPFSEEDFQVTRSSLKEIHSRVDCADFDLLDLLRIMLTSQNKYPEDLREEIKEVILNFRYWMDENGSDGMCFFSENHALCFHACQLMAGKLYPQERFVRSGRTGKEQAAVAADRCRQWLDSIETAGSEEFSAPGYMAVTLIGLFALVDFAEEDVARRAWQQCDRILESACSHFFDGAMISPCGRIYGDVIKPFKQAVLSLMNYFRKDLPLRDGTKIGPIYELTHYQADPRVLDLIHSEIHRTYEAGNAQVHICKTGCYMLTSVASPRSDDFRGGWSGEAARRENPFETGAFTYSYVKGLNERFHGTTLFQPGVYGYQQHMWSAALSNECVVFVNHPGVTHQMASMRPGYWYGNGLFPALRQWDNILLAIYSMDEKYPICFTHTYFPRHTFDEVWKEGNWLFGRKGKGLIALWCSCSLTEHNDYLTDCEYRAYEKAQGYVCICSDTDAEGSFARFMDRCHSRAVTFDAKTLTLHDGEGHTIQYKAEFNDSQVV